MAFATIQITQGAAVGSDGESVIGLVPGTNVTLTDAGGVGANSYLWEILQWPAPDAVAPTVNNSTSRIATVVAGAGLTDGVYIVRLTRDDPVDGVSTQVRFFAVADDDGLSLPVAGMNRNMTNILGSSEAQEAGWFGSAAGGTNVFLDAFLRLRKAREGQVRCSSNDTTFANLETKIAAGAGITKTTLNDGGAEQVEISSASNVVLTPPEITADQNDYNPTGWANAGRVRLSTDASRTITGFALASAQPTKIIVNVGSNDLVLAHQSIQSSVASQITTSSGQDLTLAPNDATTLWYDATTGTWRVLDASAGGIQVVDSFVATGGEAEFTLSEVPDGGLVTMVVEGLVQAATDVVVTGTSVAYSGSTVLAGQKVDFRYVTGGVVAVGGATAQPHGLEHSPIVLYNFDGDRTDSSGNGLDIDTDVNTPSLIRYGELLPGLPSIQVQGGGFETAVDPLLNITGALTVEWMMFLEREAISTERFFLSIGGNSGIDVLFRAQFYSTAFWAVRHHDSTPTYQTDVSNLEPFGRVVHMAITRSADGLTYKWYVNGAHLYTSTMGSAPSTDTGQNLSMFTHPSATGFDFDISGEVASVKVIAAELSAAEVAAEYNRTLGPVYGVR